MSFKYCAFKQKYIIRIPVFQFMYFFCCFIIYIWVYQISNYTKKCFLNGLFNVFIKERSWETLKITLFNHMKSIWRIQYIVIMCVFMLISYSINKKFKFSRIGGVFGKVPYGF